MKNETQKKGLFYVLDIITSITLCYTFCILHLGLFLHGTFSFRRLIFPQFSLTRFFQHILTFNTVNLTRFGYSYAICFNTFYRFTVNGINLERSTRFQRELRSCTASYEELLEEKIESISSQSDTETTRYRATKVIFSR